MQDLGCACTHLSRFILALMENRAPHCWDHHPATFQGHCCDRQGLMCILPELDLILGTLPRGPPMLDLLPTLTPNTLLSPPLSFSVSNKQKQNCLFWSSRLFDCCIVTRSCTDLCRRVLCVFFPTMEEKGRICVWKQASKKTKSRCDCELVLTPAYIFYVQVCVVEYVPPCTRLHACLHLGTRVGGIVDAPAATKL